MLGNHHTPFVQGGLRLYLLGYPHVLRILRCNLLDGEACRLDDSGDAFVFARALRPAHCEISRLLTDVEWKLDVRFQSKARSLKNAGDRRAHERKLVRTGFRNLDVTRCKNRGQPVTAVPAKNDV